METNSTSGSSTLPSLPNWLTGSSPPAPTQTQSTLTSVSPPDLSNNTITATGELIPLSLDQLLERALRGGGSTHSTHPSSPTSTLSNQWVTKSGEPFHNYTDPRFSRVLNPSFVVTPFDPSIHATSPHPNERWFICKELEQFASLWHFYRSNAIYAVDARTLDTCPHMPVLYAGEFLAQWDKETKEAVWRRTLMDRREGIDSATSGMGYVRSFYDIMTKGFHPERDWFNQREDAVMREPNESQVRLWSEIDPSTPHYNVMQATRRVTGCGENTWAVAKESPEAWCYRVMVLPNGHPCFVRLNEPCGAITVKEYIDSGLVNGYAWAVNGTLVTKGLTVIGKGGITTTRRTAVIREIEPWLEEVFEDVLEDLYEGMSIESVLARRGLRIKKGALIKWINDDTTRQERYMMAQMIGAEIMAAEVLNIADGVDASGNPIMDDTARSKLRIEARKWLTAVYNNRRYGAKQTVDVNTSVSINDALEEARARVLGRVIDVE